MNDFVHSKFLFYFQRILQSFSVENAHLIYALTGIGFLVAVKLLLNLLVAVYDVFVASGVNIKAKYGGADHYACKLCFLVIVLLRVFKVFCKWCSNYWLYRWYRQGVCSAVS